MRVFSITLWRLGFLCLLASAAAGASIAQTPVYWIDDPAVSVKPRMDNKKRRAGPKIPHMRWFEVGETRMMLCIGADGAITEAVPAGSSKVLDYDKVFVAWLAKQEFLPGQAAGAPAEICGVEVIWVWQGGSQKGKPPRIYPEYRDLDPEQGPALVPGTLPPVRTLKAGDAHRHEQSGRQSFDVCVGPTGEVEEVLMTWGLMNPILNEAGLAWARSLKFTPATKGGAPAGVCGIDLTYIWPKVS